MSKLSEFSHILTGTFTKKIYLSGTKSTCGGLEMMKNTEWHTVKPRAGEVEETK
jgi:hypothetical protein